MMMAYIVDSAFLIESRTHLAFGGSIITSSMPSSVIGNEGDSARFEIKQYSVIGR